MTPKYSFEVMRELTPDEISSLAKEHYPSLVILNDRYAPEFDLSARSPATPQYLDVIRTSWLLDSATDRPPHATLVRALAPILGMLLHDLMHLDWCVIKDSLGEIVSMVGTDRSGGTCSVPLVSYIEKREHLQNAEVFANLISHLSERFDVDRA